MAKEITTTVEKVTDPPPKSRASMTVNEKIQVTRFYARFVIACSALAIFAYVVHIMLGSGEELPTSSKDLLNILVGAFIPILAGISKFYFDSGGDLAQEPEKHEIPPHDDNKEDSEK